MTKRIVPGFFEKNFFSKRNTPLYHRNLFGLNEEKIMPLSKGGFEAKFSSDKILEVLKKLEAEEQILAGLYFYESLSVDEISIIIQKHRNEIRSSLNTIFTKISGTPLQKDKVRMLTSDVLR
jgi:hypothetical protein